MTYNQLKPHEVDFITKNYPVFGTKYCAEIINRSKSIILIYAKKLNLSVVKQIPEGFKKCSCCLVILPITVNFYISGKGRPLSECINCCKQREINQKIKRRSTDKGKRKDAIDGLFNSSRLRSIKLNLPFDLSKDWIDKNLPEICPVLGIPIQICTGKLHHNSPSIDKINPNLGYTMDNCKIISWRANAIKNNGLLSEFKEIIKYVKRHKNMQ